MATSVEVLDSSHEDINKVSNADLQKRREAAIPRGLGSVTSIYADHAENAEIWDTEGRRHIDFAGGIAVLNTGHRHPKVMAAVENQCQRFTHTAFQVMGYDVYIELAERLNALVPIDNAKTILMNSGAEAVENAVKIARAHTGRSGVIAFNGGFHGRSLLTMGLTGKVVPYKTKFGPFPGDIYHVPFPMPQHGVSEDQSLSALQWLFKADIEPNNVAAIILEPVQGEGGFYIASNSFFKALRDLCDEHGIVLISDEVQTGFARTGRLFASDHYDVRPDLMTMAKSLAGGFPLSAVSGRAEIMDAPEPGGLGSTYGGSPVACAAALAVLDVIEKENLNNRANEIGEIIKSRLNSLKQHDDIVPMGDVRGLGAMVAFELVTEKGGNTPAPSVAKDLVSTAEKNGLILLSCGVYANTIRILVPLTVSDTILNEGMAIIEKSMRELADNK